MKKFLKWFFIVLGALILVAVIGFQVMKWNTKQHSPQDTVSLNKDGLKMEVVYSRPFKKDREIFGGLVPYGEVWRTGANEATTFSTNEELIINGKTLPAGDYTLWTIPGPREWTVIFNEGEYGWGVNWDGKATRDPALDVLSVDIKHQRSIKPLEQFTIDFRDDPSSLIMRLGWDVVRIDVPIEKAD